MSSAVRPHGRTDSWRSRTALQQPDTARRGRRRVGPEGPLGGPAALVFAGERVHLRTSWVSARRAFLHRRVTAQVDSFSANSIRERLRVILRMAIVLTSRAFRR
ncbi:MAG: hypothetical protein R2716_00670 [Microthrixaceae bacterium]